MAAPHLQPAHTGFNPTREDIYIAARILMGLRLPRPPAADTPAHLPPELARSVLSHAGYNPRITSSRADEARYHADDFWQPGPRASVAGLYLTTRDPLPGCLRRVASVTLQVRAADQGWATFGGEGTYENSHTWFEACVLRPVDGGDGVQPVQQEEGEGEDEPLETRGDIVRVFETPGDARGELEQFGWRMVEHGGRSTWLVHHNITASRAWKDYRVDWVAGEPTEIDVPGAVGDGEGFLDALMPGDKIALWARAEQQAWVIKVAEACIEVVYEVDI
ncbi:hypothetical protein KVR01_013657 [Diaporthe batatas]|uniref:uncharacterized protein n=1 Tax=Diaporthe batatas TaxID=748121 RepID=UPI001D03807E|nr:uncharacterized protein KVR01_013657 [Diaporthe batatas]KAG8156553.1 hypothetical protein KVR01_013657 [Diaporthe batatas]